MKCDTALKRQNIIQMQDVITTDSGGRHCATQEISLFSLAKDAGKSTFNWRDWRKNLLPSYLVQSSTVSWNILWTAFLGFTPRNEETEPSPWLTFFFFFSLAFPSLEKWSIPSALQVFPSSCWAPGCSSWANQAWCVETWKPPLAELRITLGIAAGFTRRRLWRQDHLQF